MNFLLSEEHDMMRKMVREFALNEVAPTAGERDEEEKWDMAIWHKMAKLGLTGIPWPEEIWWGRSRFFKLCTRFRGNIQGRCIRGYNTCCTLFFS